MFVLQPLRCCAVKARSDGSDRQAKMPPKHEKKKCDVQSKTHQFREHPSSKPKIEKDIKSTDSHASSEREGKKRAPAKLNARPKEDIDDMEEIFSKPHKSIQSKGEISEQKSSTAGPDMAEIAKEAEKYKGSSNQGAVALVSTRTISIFMCLNVILITHLYPLKYCALLIQADESMSMACQCTLLKNLRKRWASRLGTHLSRRQNRHRLLLADISELPPAQYLSISCGMDLVLHSVSSAGIRMQVSEAR